MRQFGSAAVNRSFTKLVNRCADGRLSLLWLACADRAKPTNALINCLL